MFWWRFRTAGGVAVASRRLEGLYGGIVTEEATASTRVRRLAVALSVAMLVGVAIGWGVLTLIVDRTGIEEVRSLSRDRVVATGVPPSPRPSAGPTATAPDASVPGSSEPPATDTSLAPVPTIEPTRQVPDRDADRRSLAAHRAVWEAKRPARYQFNLQTGCFCALDEYVVVVRNGVVASAEPVSSTTRSGAPALTLDQVFDRASAAIETGGYYAVVYDETWGFPLTISTVVGGETQEGQMTYATSLFRPLA